MKCQPMKCQDVHCQPICQCQPGYVQCAQKCCLRYRKVNNNNFSPLQHNNNNKISKFGTTAVNGATGQLLMAINRPSANSALSASSLLSAPISKRTMEQKLFQKH
jgi:transglutaminase/protease-like cytokinesis protein 3